MTKTLKISIVISILFIGLIRFRPIWERNPGGFWNVLFFLGIAVLFFWLLTKIIIEFFRILKKRKELSIKIFIPILILIIGITDGIFNPFKIDLDSIYGKTIFHACYEGTMNQAILKLRDNGDFAIQWSGFIYSSEFYTGKYLKNQDTLLLNFKTEIPRDLDDTLIIKDEFIYRLKNDSLISTHFYLGDCKGLN